jgi:hypothetical protein
MPAGAASYAQLTVNIVESGRVIVVKDAYSVQGSLDSSVRLLETLSVLTSLLSENKLETRQQFALLGSCLFDHLFAPGTPGKDDVRGTVKHWLEDLPEHEVLRVVLQFSDRSGDAAEFPWEYLYLPGDFLSSRQGFLATGEELVLSRQIWLPDGAPRNLREAKPEALRILVGIASPEGEEYVVDEASGEKGFRGLADLKSTASTFCDALKASGAEPVIEPALTRSRLAELLQSPDEALRPHVVHIIAHGNYVEKRGGFLALCDAESPRRASWTSDSDLADCFSHKPGVVFLHACSGAKTDQIRGFRGVALKLVERGVPAVIAMNFEIDTTAATTFAIKFYQGLAEGLPIDHAVQLGRKQLGDHGHLGSSMAEGNFSGRAFGSPVAFVQVPGAVILATEGSLESVDQPAEALKCPQCLKAVLPVMKRCGNCSIRIALCPSSGCGQMLNAEKQFCPWCGRDAAPEEARASGSLAPLPSAIPSPRLESARASSVGPRVKVPTTSDRPDLGSSQMPSISTIGAATDG